MTPAEIKSRYRLIDEVRSRGIEINRQGFCHCPIHAADDTPSMKIYEDQNTFHCYGCGEGGDIIDFVMKVDGLSFRDACKAISDEELTKEQRFVVDRAKMRREAERIREEKKQRKILDLADRICWLWNMMKEFKPTTETWIYLYNQWQMMNYRYSELTGEEIAELWR